MRGPVHDGRFAPSPTGTLHVGNLRTALLAWLFARSQDAPLPDARRGPRHRRACGRRFDDEQLADLAALGLDWDGPVVRQSERIGALRGRARRLDADGLLYRVLVHARGDPRGRLGPARRRCPRAPTPGTCRRLTRRASAPSASAAGARRRCACAPGGRASPSTTACWGRVEGVVDDFVVRRNDGASAYNLAVVVDDAEQGIGEVVRGADLLDTTPRQLQLGAPARAAGARLRPRAAHARPRRRPPGQAPRRGDAGRPRRARARRRRTSAPSSPRRVGLARAGRGASRSTSSSSASRPAAWWRRRAGCAWSARGCRSGSA